MISSSPKSNTVLVIFPSTERGGCEEYILTITKALYERGYDVHVAFPDKPGTLSLQKDFKSISKSYTPLRFSQFQSKKIRKINLVRNIIKLIWLMLRINPKAIHLTLPWPDSGTEAILAAAILKIRTIVTFQLVNDQFKISPQLRKQYLWAKNRNQYWVGVSKNTARLLAKTLGITEDSIYVINNGVSLTTFSRKAYSKNQPSENPSYNKSILTVARLSHQKGHDILLHAFSRISDKFPNYHLYFIGEGELAIPLRVLVKQLKIEDRVFFLGYKEDVRDWLASSDLFVLPSRSEGLPFCLLEAMAMELPVISSALDNLTNVVSDGHEGLLFEPENIEALTTKLTWALENESKMKEMAQHAKDKVEFFSSTKMAQETIDLLFKNS